MKKKKVLDEININTDMFMTSFEKASKLLIEQKEQLEKDGWSSIHLKMNYHHSGSELVAKGMRLETDKEFEKRKKKLEKKRLSEERKLERERKKYEELKEKFENDET